MNENEVEARSAELNLNAPRATPALVDAEIAGSQFHVFPGTTLTVCAITLKNGFIVTGISASVSPQNFDKYIGESLAYAEARDKIWPLLGFRLREQAFQAQQTVIGN